MERRVQDRRESLRNVFLDHSRKFFLAVLILSSLVVWKWRYIVHAPMWALRAYWADRSDIYKGKTNDIPNLKLVQQARQYLTDLDRMDASGNFARPEVLRTVNVRVDPSWFERHPPEIVDYNPFVSGATGNFIVSWLYVPGCQKPLSKYVESNADWYDLQGQPCSGVCRVSVFMEPSLRLTAVKLDPIRY